VHVKVKELQGDADDVFSIDLPCRPVVGDIINVASAEVDWVNIGKKSYQDRLDDAGKPPGEALQVTAVVFMPASGEDELYVLAKQCHDPFVLPR
jgi:hypothetical protein